MSNTSQPGVFMRLVPSLRVPHWLGIAAIVLLCVWSLISLFPIYMMLLTAFRPTDLIIASPPNLLPSKLTLDNFVRLFGGDVARWTLNTLIVAAGSVIGSVTISTLAGFAFAKYNFPGKSILFWGMVATIALPLPAIIVPLYRLVLQFHLTDTYFVLIAPSLAAPAGIFLMRQFMQTIPADLLDAARVDGASEFRVFARVVLPLSTAPIIVLSIFAFVDATYSFLWPLIVTNDAHMNVLTTGLASLQLFAIGSGVKDFGLMMAGATWTAIPVVSVFIIFQRYFLQGIKIGTIRR
jgi:multiple sugar transport system permease protein